jgi:uncharacterized protein YheU (UPF0270 family)
LRVPPCKPPMHALLNDPRATPRLNPRPDSARTANQKGRAVVIFSPTAIRRKHDEQVSRIDWRWTRNRQRRERHSRWSEHRKLTRGAVTEGTDVGQLGSSLGERADGPGTCGTRSTRSNFPPSKNRRRFLVADIRLRSVRTDRQ